MFTSPFAKVWDTMSATERGKLLREAGHQDHNKVRCFQYLTYHERLDVEYTAKRQGLFPQGKAAA